ncbi:DUF2628 domain-containing protein [Vibrio porteresiae]|uniref:DUF2628 domain-containing protein n=1 Tax=Vibrio porteresiae DSM 19223 TaxID=1123496 RepID=A0ABZ0QGX9_9VIBR|nr:DUF2628 domain-containing protein [Vibrio porteresiae]WPC75748.1 DUF2628 domain-containing protein [Vibrio porteresiae DSM 19223]
MTMETQVAQESQLSSKWLERFELFDQLKAIKRSRGEIVRSERYRTLAWRQRLLISTNFLAFLFGPLYYFAKKMYRKGFIITGVSSLWAALLTYVDYHFHLTIPAIVYSIVPGVICASYANLDYYLKKELGETMWAKAPFWLHTQSGVAIATLIGLGCNIGVIQYVMGHEHYTFAAQQTLITQQVRCGDEVLFVSMQEYRFNSQDSLCELVEE